MPVGVASGCGLQRFARGGVVAFCGTARDGLGGTSVCRERESHPEAVDLCEVCPVGRRNTQQSHAGRQENLRVHVPGREGQEEPLRDHELARAIDETLEVFEVAGQSDVAEDGLLELVVESVVRAVDTDAGLLLVHGTPFRLHPVHVVLVAFHVREKIVDARACAHARHKLNPAFDNVEV
jgi:hypothetical protein